MKPVIDGLTESQIRAASAYYASLENPKSVAATGDLERGKWLVERGNWDAGVPACSQCHGPNGRGINDVFPSLAGQSALYMTNQITAWKKGTRTNDANGLMASVAKRISDVVRYGRLGPSTKLFDRVSEAMVCQFRIKPLKERLIYRLGYADFGAIGLRLSRQGPILGS